MASAIGPNGLTISPNGLTISPNGFTISPNGFTIGPNGTSHYTYTKDAVNANTMNRRTRCRARCVNSTTAVYSVIEGMEDTKG